MGADLKKVFGSTEELTRFQSNLDNWAKSQQTVGLNNGVLLNSIALVSGQTNLVEHKLGREILGWIIVRKRGPADIWDIQDANKFKTSMLALNTTANVTVDLWVF